ncbi:sensor domain-containing diguanylate cyclase [Acinetobacter terrae]|jgi:diguanylate cyclase (GGDEF)-like protein|uniref:diguanylate cyclase n=1 Tax=Acinetobacter terrae TaxID=2731247 RepID=A0A4R0EHA8_9GAMM|nr:sensor domain-containing diguanylate cyclase [Acinetobacter terrae]NNH78739.1 sensor domain-containing diguanylate cyclase [Acinetobacter terrae]OAL86710.1 histidine kinase [Acinetobacter terrae]TCB55991.1 sensor domain-containing diguanylate cyclase [Acinetobacter terrae]
MNTINFKNFEEAGQAILQFLHKRFGFDLWMITRVEGKDWIVLQSEDHGYDIKPGHVFKWADSFCSHMVKGKAPKIAPHCEDIPLYATAPISQQVSIKSYIGQPILNEDGSLFGTLCAIDPHPKPETIVQDIEIIELLGNLLSKILQAELRQNQQFSEVKRLKTKAFRDGLTGLYNRRAWDELISKEEERCKRYGHSAAVFFIDINNLKEVNDNLGHVVGDHLIQQAANVLSDTVRSNDIVARLGGDEFVILSVENNKTGAERLLKRIIDAFAQAKISIAIGFSMRHPARGLLFAAEQADKKMFEHKRQFKFDLKSDIRVVTSDS